MKLPGMQKIWLGEGKYEEINKILRQQQKEDLGRIDTICKIQASQYVGVELSARVPSNPPGAGGYGFFKDYSVQPKYIFPRLDPKVIQDMEVRDGVVSGPYFDEKILAPLHKKD